MNSDVSCPVNLGSSQELSVQQIALEIIQLINPKLSTKNVPLPIDDPKLRRPDTTLAKTLLGWQPTTSLDDGLRAMINDFSSLT